MFSPSDLQRQFFDLWNRRDFEKMKTLLHADYTYTGPDGKEQAGPLAGLKAAQIWASAFPDGRIEIKNVLSQGKIAVCEFIGRGHHDGELMGVKPTGKAVEVRVVNLMEMRDGKIYREREYMDMLSVLGRLGAVTLPGSRAA